MIRLYSMLEFNELQYLLTRMRSGIGAPECHGFLSGYLCVSDTMNNSVWDYLCADVDGAEPVTPEYRAALQDLGTQISSQMLSSELDFRLLQPDESASLPDRCVALASWCQGFLSGLGVAGTIDWNCLSDECHELIADLYDISRLGADPGNQSDEEQETSLLELSEYVRMGVIYIHEELAGLKAGNEAPGVIH